jgi:hypothetical protein
MGGKFVGRVGIGGSPDPSADGNGNGNENGGNGTPPSWPVGPGFGVLLVGCGVGGEVGCVVVVGGGNGGMVGICVAVGTVGAVGTNDAVVDVGGLVGMVAPPLPRLPPFEERTAMIDTTTTTPGARASPASMRSERPRGPPVRVGRVGYVAPPVVWAPPNTTGEPWAVCPYGLGVGAYADACNAEPSACMPHAGPPGVSVTAGA